MNGFRRVFTKVAEGVTKQGREAIVRDSHLPHDLRRRVVCEMVTLPSLREPLRIAAHEGKPYLECEFDREEGGKDRDGFLEVVIEREFVRRPLRRAKPQTILKWSGEDSPMKHIGFIGDMRHFRLPKISAEGD